ncbi:MAG TPA: RodZ domain-containing protein [Rhizomicrobium sp.]|jgi:cytoskeleton protein RodZ|nr:RodZ domain-containing protein [Rhizomicrobium sp.]
MTKVTHLTLEEGGGLNRRRIHLREISGEADSPLETVGQDLRAGRQRRGDDLATVSRALKIRKDHLEALEEDRFEALPGRTYAVGFVRAYSDYLGLDPVQCTERFKREIAGRGAEPTSASTFSPDLEERRLPHGWMVIAAVVLALIVYGAYHLAITADSLLKPAVANVPARMEPKLPAPAPKPVVVATPPAQTAVAPPATGAPAQQTLNVTPNGATAPAATPAAAPPQTLAAEIAALPAGEAYGTLNHDARVVLHVRQTTRILVEGNDGTVYINRVLHPGDSYHVPDRVGITLTTPNGGAVALELDGQLMGVAGKTSQMTEGLSLDPQAVVDRSSGSAH